MGGSLPRGDCQAPEPTFVGDSMAPLRIGERCAVSSSTGESAVPSWMGIAVIFFQIPRLLLRPTFVVMQIFGSVCLPHCQPRAALITTTLVTL